MIRLAASKRYYFKVGNIVKNMIPQMSDLFDWENFKSKDCDP
jgi:hypothetical protein